MGRHRRGPRLAWEGASLKRTIRGYFPAPKERSNRGDPPARLAEKVGCRRETIGKLENGKYNPSLKLALDVAKELDATVYDLFFFD